MDMRKRQNQWIPEIIGWDFIKNCQNILSMRELNIRTQESVYSSNPIVLMFAVFDKRVGKRTLEVIKERMKSQPKWLQVLYQIRIDSEKLNF